MESGHRYWGHMQYWGSEAVELREKESCKLHREETALSRTLEAKKTRGTTHGRRDGWSGGWVARALTADRLPARKGGVHFFLLPARWAADMLPAALLPRGFCMYLFMDMA